MKSNEFAQMSGHYWVLLVEKKTKNYPIIYHWIGGQPIQVRLHGSDKQLLNRE